LAGRQRGRLLWHLPGPPTLELEESVETVDHHGDEPEKLQRDQRKQKKINYQMYDD
jgi:hypothetical protein